MGFVMIIVMISVEYVLLLDFAWHFQRNSARNTHCPSNEQVRKTCSGLECLHKHKDHNNHTSNSKSNSHQDNIKNSDRLIFNLVNYRKAQTHIKLKRKLTSRKCQKLWSISSKVELTQWHCWSWIIMQVVKHELALSDKSFLSFHRITACQESLRDLRSPSSNF